MRAAFVVVAALTVFSACQKEEAATPVPPAEPPAAPEPAPTATPPQAPAEVADAGATTAQATPDAGTAGAADLYATLETSMGNIVIRLFTQEAPKTVENFVGLATGKKQWTDPRTGQPTRKPLYDGTTFHRVIPQFMIQGGDPLGEGYGGPGYNIDDEFQSGRGFDKKGLLAMANVGRPNTGGSQFFITTSLPSYLNGKHTIFGEVVQGYDVVEKISVVPRDARDRPKKAVVLKKVRISETPPSK